MAFPGPLSCWDVETVRLSKDASGRRKSRRRPRLSLLAPCARVSGAGVSRAPPRRARSFRFRGSSRSLAKGPGVLWPRVGLWLPRAEAVGMAGPLGAARSWSLCRWRCGSSENGRLCNGLRGWLPLLPLAPPPPCCPPGSPRGLPGAFVCVPLEAVAGREPQDPAERMRFINARRGGDTGPHCRHCCTFLLFACVCP